MYNRYIRSENGTYARVRVPGLLQREDAPPEQERSGASAVQQTASVEPEGDAPFADLSFLRRILERLNLREVDTGDLILLVLLFLLFEEKADEELLIALGLLLIL